MKATDYDIIAYAYIFKKLQFKVKFVKSKSDKFNFNGLKVSSFYADTKEQKQQVLVHKYNGRNDFIVEIKDKKEKDSIFLIKNSSLNQIGLNKIDEVISSIN